MVVLSLRPRFAEAILAGDKTVELRRTVPKIVVPTRALLYAATPVRALIGTCIVTDVVAADLADLWAGARAEDRAAPPRVPAVFRGSGCGCRADAGRSSALQPGDSSRRLAGQAAGLPSSAELRLRRRPDRRPTPPNGRLTPARPEAETLGPPVSDRSALSSRATASRIPYETGRPLAAVACLDLFERLGIRDSSAAPSTTWPIPLWRLA